VLHFVCEVRESTGINNLLDARVHWNDESGGFRLSPKAFFNSLLVQHLTIEKALGADP